ncbi:helix-turn-helix domain-containing protein [Chryseobacterium chendengshani]|uniref:AraC family transcriptional regulator n=1 Tax=Chryseobacterium sp. LJ668 TaxID=2864040 RepID=UPI001C68AD5B|nr:helix-turn-helix domain-containing protein [Chryseobacterium sp. LJ668]MBW8523512.1 helix-turn-helix domain-containing protein [Chryseobacterium sp. LJ668]QYK15795.1 helix-turn-helix domain-containing protein [Chryseobacterium sp. LJ668]
MTKIFFHKIVFLEIKDSFAFTESILKQYHTHLFCHRGSIKFLFNDEPMTCKAGQFLFWFAESRLIQIQTSKGFKATVLLVEKDFLTDNIPDQGWSINAQLHSRVFPVKNLATIEEKERILNNFKWINQRFEETQHRFYHEALNLQMRIFILEMWHTFANEYEQRRHSLQSGTLYQQFINLLRQHSLTQRQVQYYSNSLNITPKYLNHLCKIHSGVTASAWIQRHAKERIILLLENRNLNISEIADEMHFSSRSFFTRYVKKLLGATPGAFRERLV